MKIEINPRSLLNLEHICVVLYKLHPSVLDHLVEMERTLGSVLGFIDLDNLSLEERKFLSSNYIEKDYSNEEVKHCQKNELENQEEESEDKYNSYIFHELIKEILTIRY